jgi:hypothetical protein
MCTWTSDGNVPEKLLCARRQPASLCTYCQGRCFIGLSGGTLLIAICWPYARKPIILHGKPKPGNFLRAGSQHPPDAIVARVAQTSQSDKQCSGFPFIFRLTGCTRARHKEALKVAATHALPNWPANQFHGCSAGSCWTSRICMITSFQNPLDRRVYLWESLALQGSHAIGVARCCTDLEKIAKTGTTHGQATEKKPVSRVSVYATIIP